MSHMRFIPINADALTGACFCLRDDQGRLHCGRWSHRAQAFEYSGGSAIRAVITDYCARVPGPPDPSEERYV